MAAATAVANAVKTPLLTTPPSSPFSELLRRSKFAKYDPVIRQTYAAAPANAHRGDWGLKRPITLRRKNAFISLTSFEHPAHFTEWNHAENQVRFIRRVEEMGVNPKTVPGTPWYKSLGKAKIDLLVDSDFCPGEGSTVKLKEIANNVAEEKPKRTMVDLSTLGNRGRGSYGANRPPLVEEGGDREVYVTRNFHAMSKKAFKRYLRTLRSLRPAFQEHVNLHADAGKIATKDLYVLSQQADRDYHRKFMKEHMIKEFQDIPAQRIEPQPHPNAALMYARPTPLESLFWTKPQPGIILNEYIGSNHNKQDKKFVASFGGLTATIGVNDMSMKVPLLKTRSEEGVPRGIDDQNKSIADMRLLPRNGLSLKVPPQVVGRKPQGLKAAVLAAEVVVDLGRAQPHLDNPYPIGSPEYITNKPSTNKSTPRNFDASLPPVAKEVLIGAQGPVLVDHLKSMITKKGRPEKDDEDL